MTSKLETDIVAVERVKEYSEVETEVSSWIFIAKMWDPPAIFIIKTLAPSMHGCFLLL